MAGEDVQEGSENEVRELPKNFTDWVANNQERIDRAKSLPYFYRDNKDLIIQQTTPKQKGILELAAERHASRTPEQVAAIQEKWNTRRLQGISEQFYGLNLDATDPLTGRFLKLLMHTDSPSFADDFSALRTDVQKAWDAERKAVEKIQRQLGIKMGKHSAWAQTMLKEEKKNAARKEDFTTSRPSPWRKRAKSVMFLRPEVVSRLSSLRRVAHSRTSPMISSLRCRNCLSNCEVRYSASTSLTGTTPTTHTGENNIKISPVRGLLAAMARLRSTETQKQKPQRMTCYTR